MIRLYKGVLSPSIADTVRVNGVAFDLTGSTVKFRMRSDDSATLKVDAAAVIVGAAVNGNVRYDWVTADLNTPGRYVGWWQVTLPSGKTQDSDEFVLFVADHAPGDPRDLCTVADVKASMEPASSTNTRDPRTAELITVASVSIMRELERELTPTSTAVTRRFRVDHGWNGTVVDLAPYDLRVATTVRLHPEDANPVTLAATDYALEPVNAPQGGYNRIRLSNYLVLVSQFALKFGYAQLDVTGNWGLFDTPTVPPEVREACVLTVRSWLRQNPSVYALAEAAEGGVMPQPQQTYKIPAGAWEKLFDWRRWNA